MPPICIRPACISLIYRGISKSGTQLPPVRPCEHFFEMQWQRINRDIIVFFRHTDQNCPTIRVSQFVGIFYYAHVAVVSITTSAPCSPTISLIADVTSLQVLGVLEQTMIQFGVPGYIRSDNGPEFIAPKVQQWPRDNRIKTIYIDPGSPWENRYIENFHSRFRDEYLSREMLLNLREARVVIADWRQHYNTERPHSRLGYLSPEDFIQTKMLTP